MLSNTELSRLSHDELIKLVLELQDQFDHSAPRQISKSKLLLGEGIEEVYFFTALLKHLGIIDVQVMHYKGKSELPSFIKALPSLGNFHMVVSLGITRDADTTASTAFQSVQDALLRARLSAPGAVSEFTAAVPRVGVFILPDGHSPGTLESLCLSSIAAYPEMECISRYFDCVVRVAQRQPPDRARPKAHIHAWLASLVEPDLRLGEAAAAGHWPWDSPAFEQLKQFLRAL